jgi:hypothetical protein
MRIVGDLNVDALTKTLNTVVNRHEVLRTTINVFDGKPLQVIHENPTVDIPILDLSHFRGSEQEVEAERLLVTLARRPFDLSQDLLLRSSLLRLSDREHIFLLKHTTSLDGWSKTVPFEEFVVYEAFCRTRLLPFPSFRFNMLISHFGRRTECTKHFWKSSWFTGTSNPFCPSRVTDGTSEACCSISWAEAS